MCGSKRKCGLCKKPVRFYSARTAHPLPTRYPNDQGVYIDSIEGFICLGCFRTSVPAWNHTNVEEDKQLYLRYGVEIPEYKEPGE